mmetsp:Transcript_35988/g.55311  ORF Transcript_35988/g.55311 Transcript_35988/m.55311 type:complete len:141 (+) Transcript_35988:155-577(+)
MMQQRLFALFLLLVTGTMGFAPSLSGVRNSRATSSLGMMNSRRDALKFIAAGTFLAIGKDTANALDMDAFANGQLEADQKNCDPKRDPKCIPKLSPDEALCKYGQSGEARGEACKRVKKAGGELPSAKPQGKSLGGAYAM